MKATFSNIDLEKLLRQLLRVVPNTTNKVVLKHVLIEAKREQDRVDFYVTSEDMSFRRTLFVEATSTSVQIDESGSCLLPAKEVHEIIKRANGPVTLETQKERTVMMFGKTKYDLAGLNPHLFTPYGNTDEQVTQAQVLAPNLHRLIRRTSYAAAKNLVRPILTGVNLAVVDGDLSAIATDALRLAQFTVPCEEVSGENRQLVIPAALLDTLAAALPASDDDEEVTFTLGTSSCTVSWGDDAFHMALRGLEGTYPNTARLIPERTAHCIVIERQGLLTACERVAILSEADQQRAEFRFTPSGLTVSATSTQYGYAEETLETIQGTKDPVELLCNVHYWIAALKAMEGVQKVEIGLNGSMHPCLLRPVDESGTSLIATVARSSATTENQRQVS
ncbi:DNA polymerase III beta subunit [Alicyclobacillus sacchari]|uniref:Beta sliding clamp n=2 Tax=Alicyclobacillus sacchari TaxID=392010 RepID=A0A4R8LBQ7_9BACL|nr:DNA polymerase III subunit beta [Alicyclobacillus sacchari]TDY40341.1 DNA polymerase III beta subunit [Alicyclobacillus sacchari]GMA59469.1 DNA polymerase III subunit beta [Alicyclobacillus sacchari]